MGRCAHAFIICFLLHSCELAALVLMQLHGISVRLSSQAMLRVLNFSCCVRLYCVARRYGVATHPTLPYYATAAEDNTIRLWSAEPHQCVAGKTLRAAVRLHGFKFLEELLQLCVPLI